MLSNRLALLVTRYWYAERPARWLAVLSVVYGWIVAARHLAYRRGWLASQRLPVPVLVVGNIVAGGAGKTPLVLALVSYLERRGRRVGIVSRGYGGRSRHHPLPVNRDTSPAEAGDEPVLLARRSNACVAVDPDRARAGRWLIETAGVDFIIADDGLQHYRLARDAEIAVTDSRRGLGNRHLIPAGPLREPVGRLRQVDLDLVHGDTGDFWLAPEACRTVRGDRTQPLEAFAGQTVHAVAGIGDPARFFAMLRRSGLAPIEHPMPDHHEYTSSDIEFGDPYPVLVTEKDAVKCVAFAGAKHWVVPVALCFSPACERRIEALIDRLCMPQEAT